MARLWAASILKAEIGIMTFCPRRGRHSVANMLQCAQDLTLESSVASHCAARQLDIEAYSSSHVSELEEKIAAPEREKLELQKFCEAKHT